MIINSCNDCVNSRQRNVQLGGGTDARIQSVTLLETIANASQRRTVEKQEITCALRSCSSTKACLTGSGGAIWATHHIVSGHGIMPIFRPSSGFRHRAAICKSMKLRQDCATWDIISGDIFSRVPDQRQTRLIQEGAGCNISAAGRTTRLLLHLI